MKYLISGGGTGGHIFPAVSIANALRELDPQAEILFVGALGRMEMERVPQAGYKIIGLPVRGFNRSQPWKNISVIVGLMRSMRMARKIIKDFRPDVGVGVGGYASGAAMKVAAKLGVPILLQEQNGFAGVTNKLLKDDAKVICVAYDHMEKFFPKENSFYPRCKFACEECLKKPHPGLREVEPDHFIACHLDVKGGEGNA